MRPAERFEFRTDATLQQEAMIAGAREMMKGQNKLLSVVLTSTLTALSGLGGAAVVALLAGWLDFSPTWWMLVGWFAGGGLYLASFQWLYRDLARYSANCPLHTAPQAITLDENGVTYDAGAARWTTPWAMIDGVVASKSALSLIVAGVSFAIPKAAIGSPDQVADLHADIQRQLGDA